MRRGSLVIAVLVAVAAASAPAPTSAQTPAAGQTLTFTLFERYLDALRDQYGIPGLSVAIVQGPDVWEGSLGKQDLEAGLAARPETPYFIGNLSQIFGSTLLLQKCRDRKTLELSDRVIRWAPYPEPATTVGQLLSHQSPTTGGYAYDTARFAGLTSVIEECGGLAYRQQLAELFTLIGMTSSVPGRALEGVAQPGAAEFSESALTAYSNLVAQMARSYRLDRGKPVRTVTPSPGADAATGVIVSAQDLARFDVALTDGILLTPSSLTLAWTQARSADGTTPLPTGLGWFVENYNNEPMIWQFDLTRDVASSMIVKLPARGLTFIVLANSDGLAAPFALSNGDALTSPFVRLFLRFFAP